jgi:glucosamine-6-phosphate deaminase
MIDAAGGIDLQLLGIGNNGHIGFNEPCDTFPRKTRVIQLTDDTIDANARFFSNRE